MAAVIVKNKIGLFFRALRLPFIAASILPFTMGSLLGGGDLKVAVFIIGLIMVACAHLSANLLNDYSDSRSGADWRDRRYYGLFGGSKLIQAGALPERFYLSAAISFALASACAAAVLAVALRDVLLPVFYSATLLAALSYSAPPAALAYKRLGELTVFILFGPVCVMGGYYIQNGGAFSATPFFVSLPFGFLTAAVLFANEVPDFKEDRAAGKMNLVGIFGPEKAYLVYYAIVFLAFFSIALDVILGYLRRPAFISFVFPVLALKAGSILKRHPFEKPRLVYSSACTVALQAMVGLSLITGFIIW